MSRIGKKPVVIPSGVKVEKKDLTLTVTPQSFLSIIVFTVDVYLYFIDKYVTFDFYGKDNKRQKALWGLFRALIQNQVEGVTKGFEKKLEVIGVGFKVAVQGTKIVMALGFSHPVEVDIPTGLTVTADKNVISISGADKQQVGQFAAEVRELKKPEPYKGKGIKYIDEVIIRKAGKVVKVVGGGK